jgi:S-adenosylmethionine synthetase
LSARKGLKANQKKSYQKLAAYGHVGRMDIVRPWEVTDTVPIL